MDFLNSKTGAPNPDVILGDRLYGAGVLPQMMPSRADTTLDYDIPPYPGEADGYKTALTEVQPWPFAADDAGVSFPAGLWGVRTRCWKRKAADGGGDKDWWTPVPRTLPSGYTAVGRCGIQVPLVADHLDGIDSGTVSWNHRTPNGLLLDLTDPTAAARSRWTPRGLNQLVESIDMSGGSYHYTASPQNNEYADRVFPIASDHVGWRYLTVTVFVQNPRIGAYSGTESFDICFNRADQPWDLYVPAPGTMQVLGNFTVNYSFADAFSPDQTFTFTFSNLVPSANGYVGEFFLRQQPQATVAPPDGLLYSRPVIQINGVFSPRVDIPLWYWASMGNRVAPGGIIIP